MKIVICGRLKEGSYKIGDLYPPDFIYNTISTKNLTKKVMCDYLQSLWDVWVDSLFKNDKNAKDEEFLDWLVEYHGWKHLIQEEEMVIVLE